MTTTWSSFIKEQQSQAYLQSTLAYIVERKTAGVVVYPPRDKIFSAFDYTAFEEVKVVILGQDPYHGPNQAHGLSFSVEQGVKIPPSLANIYKELTRDISHFSTPTHGNLVSWAKQGVLLLNTVLTVEQGQAHSHKQLGWETFTDRVIQKINDENTGVVFLLWGAHAQKKGKSIDTKKHHVLTSVHPSPLSAHRGFIGCGHFSKTNQLLMQMDKKPIDWQV